MNSSIENEILKANVESTLGASVSDEQMDGLVRLFAGTPDPTAVNRSKLHTVQEDFAAHIRNNGIRHTLEWIDCWYSLIGRATVDQTLLDELGDLAGDMDAVALTCEAYIESLACGVGSHGSSDGAKLTKDYVTAAWAQRLRRTPGRTRSRLTRWEAVRARLAAPAAPAAPAAVTG